MSRAGPIGSIMRRPLWLALNMDESERLARGAMLGQLLMVLAPLLFVLALLVRFALTPSRGWSGPGFLVALIVAALSALAFFLNRKGYYLVAATASTLAVLTGVFLATHFTLMGAMEPVFSSGDTGVLSFLVIPVLMAATFLPLRLFLLVILLTLAGVLSIPVSYADISFLQILGGPLPFLAAVLLLLVFVTYHLDRHERQGIAYLAESERRFRNLFEQSLDPVFIVGVDGLVKDVNEAVARVFGYSPAVLIGRHIETVYAAPAERSRVIEAVERDGFLHDEPLRLRTSDDTILDCVITIWPRRDSGGRILEYQTIVRDKTEHLRIEEERRLRGDLLELAFDAVLLVDPGGVIIYANAALSRLSGYSQEELTQMNIRQLNTPEDAAQVPSRISAMLREGGLEFEARWLTRDGNVLNVDVATKTIESQGRPLLLSVARDITHRKHVESELRLRSELLDLANDSVFLHDFRGKFLYVNQAAAALRGLAREEMMEMSLSDIVSAEDASRFHERVGLLVAYGSASFESRHRHKDGHFLEMEVKSRVIDIEGTSLVLSVARDISERKRAEEELRRSERKYRELFEQSMDPVAVFSADGTLLDANPAHMRLFGNTPDDVGKQVVLQHYLNPGDRDEFLKILERDGYVVDQEVRLRKKDGTEMHCVRTAVAMRDANGRITAVQTVTKDITERRKIEDALSLTQRTVDQAALRIFWIRPDGSFAYVNDEACHSLGYSREELLSMSVHDVDRNYPAKERANQWQRIKEAGVLVYETEHTDRYGNTTPVGVTSNYFAREGVELSLAFVRDISAQKKAEERLRRSEERYRMLAENTLDVIWQMDLDLRFTYVNPAVERVTGFTVDEWLGSLLSDHTREEHYRWILGAVQGELSNLDSHRGFVAEAVIVRKDGTDVPVEIHGTIITDDSDRPHMLQGVARDVSRRLKDEAELRDREEKYRQLFEQSMDAVALVAVDGTLLEANQACLQLFGWEVGAIGRGNVRELYADPAKRDDFLARLNTEGRIADEELRLRRPDGTELVCLRSGVARRDASGRLIAVQAVVRDITDWKRAQQELQESELRFRSLVENTGVGVLMTRLDGEILDCNEAAQQMFGYEREKFLSLKVRDLYANAADRDKVLEQFRRDGFLRATEIEFRRCDGSIFYLALTSTTVPLEGRDVVMSELLDVTERRWAERELRASRERLQLLAMYLEDARERERTGIARELHDQLGQVLTALSIDLTTLTLQAQAGEPCSTDMLDQMSRLVDDTAKDVRRISSELRPGMLDDIGLVAAIEWQLSQWAARTGIEYSFSPEADDSDLDRSRSTALFRVLQELLTNVARHSGATRVDVSFRRHHGHAEITVRDDGRGIREEETGHPESLGIIGMRERVRPLGGELDVSGSPGRGTTARVVVPVN